MKQLDNAKVANSFFKGNAVAFDQNIRWTDQAAWPFWYPFIKPVNPDTQTFRGGLGLMGLPIAPGAMREIVIKTRRATPYRLLNVKYEACKQISTGVNLTGTITTTLNSTAVVGVGTAFTTELLVGNTISFTDGTTRGFASIASITDNTNLVLDEGATVATAGVTFTLGECIYFETIPQSKSDLSNLTNVALTQTNATGTIGIASAGTAVTGVSTLFVTAPQDLSVGDILEYPLDDTTTAAQDGAVIFNRVATVTNDTTITVTIMNPSATTAKPYKRVATVQTGTITIISTGAVTGVATVFTTEFAVGQSIMYFDSVSGTINAATITSITDNTNMTVEPNDLTTAPALTLIALQISDDINPSSILPTFANQYTPLIDFLDVSLLIPSLDYRFKYGGTEYLPTGGLQERAINLAALQGEFNGYGMLRTESLVPAEGTITVRVTNIHPTDTLHINGTLFGYEISLSEIGN